MKAKEYKEIEKQAQEMAVEIYLKDKSRQLESDVMNELYMRIDIDESVTDEIWTKFVSEYHKVLSLLMCELFIRNSWIRPVSDENRTKVKNFLIERNYDKEIVEMWFERN